MNNNMELCDAPTSLYTDYIELNENVKNYIAVKEIVVKHIFRSEDINSIYRDLIENLKDFISNSKSFQLVLNAFNQEIKLHKSEDPISSDIKKEALNIIKKINKNAHALKFQLVKVFQIDDLEELKGLIDELKTSGYYTSACSLVTYLNVQSVEYLKTLAYPLIPKGMDSVYNFVNDDPELQIELLHHLDVLYTQKSNYYSNVIRKLIKKYDLPFEECPAFIIGSCKKNLNFINLMAKKNQISFEAWKEIVQLRVGDDPQLQKYLVSNLNFKNLEPLAEEMERVFSLPADSGYEIDEAAWPTSTYDYNYLSIEGTSISISFADTSDLFKKALQKISEEDIFAIDCEWRPEFLKDTPMSILQIATKREVFIFDMIALNQCLQEDEFVELVNLFQNDDCLKLGYAIDTDVQKLFEYFPTEISNELSNVLDLKVFYDFIKMSIPNFVENSRHSFKGLAQLSFEVLGNALDKRNQYSDWERRPLRESQITYAALDAFCLIQIYEQLKSKVNASPSYNFEDLKTSFDAGDFKNLALNVEEIPTSITDSSNNNPPIRITKIKFLADKMLNGLCRHLRILGGDCAIIENESQEAALDIYEPDRIILSTGQSYQKFLRLALKERVFYIKHNLNVYEQVKVVWEHFKVIIKQKDIFSRCLQCNNNFHISIPGGDINALIKNEKLVPAIRQYGHMKIDMNSGICANNTKLRIDLFYNREQKYVKMFDVCVECGMINWKGSHHKKVKEKYKNFCVDGDATTPSRAQSSNDELLN